MERLSDTAIAIINDLHTERLDYQAEYMPLIDAANKLSAYEDTGLEPEEYQAIGPIGHLRELAQAEKDGRLVVLPCRVGDTIWRIKRSFEEWPDDSEPYVEADAFLYRDIHCFGKTVFLTREEAEAALEGGAG